MKKLTSALTRYFDIAEASLAAGNNEPTEEDTAALKAIGDEFDLPYMFFVELAHGLSVDFECTLAQQMDLPEDKLEAEKAIFVAMKEWVVKTTEHDKFFECVQELSNCAPDVDAMKEKLTEYEDLDDLIMSATGLTIGTFAFKEANENTTEEEVKTLFDNFLKKLKD